MNGAGTKDFETVASACGLTRLLDLDLDSSYLDADVSSASAMDGSAAAAAEPLALARSAAALQRLVVRYVFKQEERRRWRDLRAATGMREMLP